MKTINSLPQTEIQQAVNPQLNIFTQNILRDIGDRMQNITNTHPPPPNPPLRNKLWLPPKPPPIGETSLSKPWQNMEPKVKTLKP